eukprot:TRINITY_DN586_c0_g1_i1.p1 TRINITY_DN586_c0_g1~~TRINITY_DN586_c0_g1_i1.p1  ORF type:complete len:361 (-),score=68.75 TRINITY_DN586_c0_g1_i1:5-1018(-)
MMKRITFFFILFGSYCFAQNDTCITDPSQPSCAQYRLNDTLVLSQINSNCMMMPDMIGCSIQHLCKESDNFDNSPYCEDFSILKELCTDMGMGPCKDYKSMCTPNNSVVQECKADILPLPSSMMLLQQIQGICTDMPDMTGCDKCTGEEMIPCDVLTVYSDLCQMMPSMGQCSYWENTCMKVPDWPICSKSSDSYQPEMRMYFHDGIQDYVLFKGWVPRKDWQYVLTWIAIAVLAFSFEAFKFMRTRLEKIWEYNAETCHQELDPLNGTPVPIITPWRWNVDPARSVLQFIETAWSLILMLVAMTFNIGLFFALCAGSAIGTLVFGRFLVGQKNSHH